MSARGRRAARSPSPDSKTRTLGHAGDVDPVEAARWDRFGWVLQQMMWVCLVSHMLFLVVFSVVGVRSLVLVNVGSVSDYLVGVALLRRGRIRAAFVIGVVEVTVHAVAASIVLGWASGFHVYIPILAVLAFLFPQGRLAAMQRLAVVLTVIYTGLALVTDLLGPSFPLPHDTLQAVRVGNSAFLVLILAFLSYVFSATTRQAENDLRDAVTRLDEISRKDALTGIMNRRQMELELNREAARHSRSGRTFAIVLCDLDLFKEINDRHGHHAGDQVLVSVATCMLDALRTHDLVARWGGEEFLLLLPESEARDAMAAAERVRSAVHGLRVEVDGQRIDVTATFGVAVFDGDWTNTLRRADRALYGGKAAGRDRVVASA